MRRSIAIWMVCLALTATTLAWAGDTASRDASCPPDCRPCPTDCSVACPPCE